MVANLATANYRTQCATKYTTLSFKRFVRYENISVFDCFIDLLPFPYSKKTDENMDARNAAAFPTTDNFTAPK